MDKNMANRMCCDLDIRDYYTKAPIMRVDFCNTTTYGFNSDAVFANRKGAKAIKFESPLEGNIDIKNAYLFARKVLDYYSGK